jgi:hypothetical protein
MASEDMLAVDDARLLAELVGEGAQARREEGGAIGICTVPPLASALYRWPASASLAIASDSAMHWKSSGPLHMRLDIMMSAPLMRRQARMILSSNIAGTLSGAGYPACP